MEPENTTEDWPHLDGSLKSILANRKSPSDLSRTKYKGLKAMLRMPKEELKIELIKECKAEIKFIQSHGNVNASSQPIYKPSSIATQFLAMNDIKPLKKRSTKFSRAQYFCHLCEYHCDTIEICISHIEDTRHSRLAKKQELETTLYHLPRPNKKHLEALENLLLQIEREVGLSTIEMIQRETIARHVDEILRQRIPGSFVRSYGSSMTGIGLKSSGLNLDFQIPPETAPHEALIKAFQTLTLKTDEFSNVNPDFTAKIPVVSFNVGDVRCELSLNNHLAYQTSALLRDYVQVEPRVKTLLISLRFWAHICKLDRQAEGTLPPHAFALLMIHFLQRLRVPLLPCIHDFITLGENDSYITPVEKLVAWKTENQMSCAELWIEFFEHYSLGITSTDNIISVRSTANCTKEDRQWKGKKMAIEDPFSTKRSLTRSVNSLRVLDFITDCFRIAYLYFGTVQTTLGPIVTKIIVPPSSLSKTKKRKRAEKASQDKSPEDTAVEEMDNILNKLKLEDVNASNKALPAKAITLEELERSLIQNSNESPLVESSEDEDDDSIPNTGESFEAFAQRVGTALTPKQALRITDLVPKNMISFKFNDYILTAGQSPILVCTVCGNEGHLQNKCPDEQLPPLKNLPEISPGYKELINRVCTDVMQCRVPSARELSGRENLMKELIQFVRQAYPTAMLTVFGSSVNGFSFSKSDLDISLTFSDHETGDDLPAISIIENLAEKLTAKQGLINVQAITSAKVPIIKFTNKMPKIECDISLYNILAQENTRMLRTYSSIDSRVKVLGYVVKEFAKICDIGDASRGSLSSYAYILMLIYYLQQVKPPIVPVLQELSDPSKNERPVKIVDGWNAWFYSDLQNLKKIWPGLGANKMSVADLWIGFLHFYAGGFDDARLVVSIRMSRHLGKFEKMWNSPCIAIEDPFDLSHNLGAGISRKMNMFIKTAFIRTRELFGIPSPKIPKFHSKIPIEQLKAYFFDQYKMTDGQPPNDRGCRACGKIGHLVRDCPKKKASDDHKKARKDNKNNTAKGQQQDSRENRSSEGTPRPSTAITSRPPPLTTSAPASRAATASRATSVTSATTSTNSSEDKQGTAGPDFLALLQSGGLLPQTLGPPPALPLLGGRNQGPPLSAPGGGNGPPLSTPGGGGPPPSLSTPGGRNQGPPQSAPGGGGPPPPLSTPGGGGPPPSLSMSGGGGPPPPLSAPGGGGPPPSLSTSGVGGPPPPLSMSGGGGPPPPLSAPGGGGQAANLAFDLFKNMPPPMGGSSLPPGFENLTTALGGGMSTPPPLPALPNSAISVEDLERNFVSNIQEPKEPTIQLPPSLDMFLPPPPPNLVQSGFMNPGLGLSNLGNQPWPQTGLGFPQLGGLGPGGLPPHPFGPLGPSLMAPLGGSPLGGSPLGGGPLGGSPLGSGPLGGSHLGGGPLGGGPLGGGPLGGAPGFQRSQSPPQEKPLQLNQLPGFNLFNGSYGLFDAPPRPQENNDNL